MSDTQKPILGRIERRVYRNHDHVYLIETSASGIVALSTSRYRTPNFTGLVAIRVHEGRIFLEDGTGASIEVRNFKLTAWELESYLGIKANILFVPNEREPVEYKRCSYCQKRIPAKDFKQHMMKHGIGLPRKPGAEPD